MLILETKIGDDVATEIPFSKSKYDILNLKWSVSTAAHEFLVAVDLGSRVGCKLGKFLPSPDVRQGLGEAAAGSGSGKQHNCCLEIGLSASVGPKKGKIPHGSGEYSELLLDKYSAPKKVCKSC